LKRRDFQELARIRLKEARLLLGAGCWEGAYYLGGYAVECLLKACIARKTERHDFPDKDRTNQSYTHDLEKLLHLAGLGGALKEAERRDPQLELGWQIVGEWSEKSRYEKRSQAEAEALLAAIQRGKTGVYPWLKKHC
jgi:HEPN domain-containing protein